MSTPLPLDTEPPPPHGETAPDLTSDFRAVFRHVASSAWVATGIGPGGPVGFTAISVVSVSVDPPLVSFNIAKTSSSLDTIARTRRAALHVLGDDQPSLSLCSSRATSKGASSSTAPGASTTMACPSCSAPAAGS